MKNPFYLHGEQKKSKPLNLTLILAIAVLVVILLWLSTFLYFPDPGGELGPNEIGDMFGMANALFSALAFAFLIYTSLLQMQELRLQRLEMEENREQLKSSAEAHQERVKLTQQQIDLTTQIHLDQLVPKLKFLGYNKKDMEHYFELHTTNMNVFINHVEYATDTIAFDKILSSKGSLLIRLPAGTSDFSVIYSTENRSRTFIQRANITNTGILLDGEVQPYSIPTEPGISIL
jgi:hypothetical protein